MTQDSRKKSVEIVKRSKPRSASHKVTSQDSFLDGFVSKVNYQDDGASRSVWVVFTSRYENHAEKESQLIQQMDAAVGKHADKWGWVKTIFNITGWLAVILIGVSAYLLVTEKEVPEFLKASFLTVVGFYFGGLLNEKKQTDSNGG
ncbi:hypothetical protein CYL31_08695 [Marinomonas sp. A3A]|nr:hypothetical protein CYL31_08695 [Marinomonas sp. A3A]